MEQSDTVAVYIDGFALYHALLRKTFPQYKWLDVRKMCELLFPERDVASVKYFSAPMKPFTNDPGIGQRQQAYWDALRESRVEIVEGNFIFSKQYLPYHPEQLDGNGRVMTVRVKRPEEKGTDVALATHLLIDAFESPTTSFAILTNDSDLVPPIQKLAERGFDISLISVVGPAYNKAFTSDIIRSVRQIRDGVLAASQLPVEIISPSGRRIRKPPSWG